MPFDLSFITPDNRTPPTPERIEEAVRRVPWLEPTGHRPGEGWAYEYLNQETGVACTFRWSPPKARCPVEGYELTGLDFSLPFGRPSFFARETLPYAATVAHTLGARLCVLSGQRPGEALEPDVDELIALWNEGNRRTLLSMARTGGGLPPALPRPVLEEMWRYQMAREELLKRYEGKGVYVPRVLLIRNKLDRQRILRAAVWTDLGLAVIPQCEAFIINKYRRKVLGLFGGGQPEPVVVRAEKVMALIERFLRTVDRPVEHRVLERAGILDSVQDLVNASLSPRFSNFETVYVDDVVDAEA